jgi:hypothetical protein
LCSVQMRVFNVNHTVTRELSVSLCVFHCYAFTRRAPPNVLAASPAMYAPPHHTRLQAESYPPGLHAHGNWAEAGIGLEAPQQQARPEG